MYKDVGSSMMMKDISASKHHDDPSASVPSLRLLSHSPSIISQSRSEGDSPLDAPTLVQDPSVIDLPSQSDIIIAVMGPTGAGKSTFINKAAGIEETEVGHGLESCTHQIQVVRCFDREQNRQIVFVDTPGFDDTNISDLDILHVIADWLKLTYEKEIRLSGLLFFHRISDNRMAGSPLKHLKTFHNLCGVEALKNVVLVTTMWDQVDEDVGNNRENELTTKFWKTMIELGCHTSRFDNTAESAMDIVSQFQDSRCTVLLQRELVDLHLELAETSAGRTLFAFLVELIKKIKELLAQIEAKLRQNQNSPNRIAIEKAKARTVTALRIANVQRKRYSAPPSVFRRISSSRRLSQSTPVNAGRPLTPSHLPSPDVSPNTASRPKITPVVTSGPLTSSPIDCFSPPPSPADATQAGRSKTQTVLQGTITALKVIQQIVGLAPVPALQSLVGVVLNVAQAVNDMYDVEEALIELARNAGYFMVTLVEQGAIAALSASDSMNSVIDGLTSEMQRVLGVVNKISAQRSLATRFLLSSFDKAAVDDCNRQMALACGIFGIHLAFISQQAIARIEAKLNLALKFPQESNKQTTPAQRASERASTWP
jgi:energy-coupling factor transporter ATP-binding protein EcfA2